MAAVVILISFFFFIDYDQITIDTQAVESRLCRCKHIIVAPYHTIVHTRPPFS